MLRFVPVASARALVKRRAADRLATRSHGELPPSVTASSHGEASSSLQRQQRLARVSSAPKPACQTEPHIGVGRIPSLRGEHEQPRPAGSTAGHKGEGGSRSCHAAAAATQPWPFQVPRAAACCPLPGLRHLDVPLLWRTSRASHRDPRPQRMPIRVGSAPRWTARERCRSDGAVKQACCKDLPPTQAHLTTHATLLWSKGGEALGYSESIPTLSPAFANTRHQYVLRRCVRAHLLRKMWRNSQERILSSF
ncbi:hypothetical protein E2C01_060333 [Portunus trituberculatus]|uniref:Uncharacterized protein n=1 Tax=Portunus trituberculatus TaxID=210409 RepID=A0A5B7HA65_PORTR|nr:hypothetical protein [Portunus trituberculatus]